MNKRCTNPTCRKMFSTLEFGGVCPHCGKAYPQLVNLMSEFIPSSNQLVNCHVTKFDPTRKVAAIKTLRAFYASAEGNSLGLKEAKDTVEGTSCLKNVRGSLARKIQSGMKEIGAEVRFTLPRIKSAPAKKKQDAKELSDPANKKQAAAIPPEKHGKKASSSRAPEKSKEEITRENQYRKSLKKVRLKNRGLNPGIPGTTLHGVICRITDFGAFVDFGFNRGLRGLIHLSNFPTRCYGHPELIVQVGDMVKVSVESSDLSKGRISLSFADRTFGQQEALWSLYKFRLPVEQLGLSARTCSCLKRAGVNLLNEIPKKYPDEKALYSIRGLSRKGCKEIKAKMHEVDLPYPVRKKTRPEPPASGIPENFPLL